MAKQPNVSGAARPVPTANRQAPPPPPPETAAVVGVKMVTNLGQGNLRPGIGKIVQRTGQPYRCGSIIGRAFSYVSHPNSKDNKRTSYRFIGEFMLVTYDGEILTGNECYLPSALERTAKAVLDMADKPNSNVVPLFEIGHDVWCEPDDPNGQPSPLGYRYVCYDRKPKDGADATLQLAYRTGILEPPTPAIADQSEGSQEVDPETGEVMPATTAEAA